MRHIFLVGISLFFYLATIAQNQGELSGLVIDAETGEKLTGVNIYFEDTSLGVSSDDKGRFQMKNIAVGKYYIIASFVGYEKFRKAINIKKGETQKIRIVLQPKSENLAEIIITEKSEARQLREKAMPISVISMSQLQGTVNGVQDVLNKTVGVTIRSTGGVGSASRLSVRGLEGKRIGFFIDEAPMNDNSDFIDVNDIPTDMIDRIEIYKGVVPAKFGGSSMGGAVNIVVKEYPARYADFSYTLESYNTHKAQMVMKRHIADKGIMFGGGGFYTYSDNSYEMESPHIPGLKIKREHDNFKKIVGAATFKATKWWFDEVEIELPVLYTRKEIQGVETDIRQAYTESMAYVCDTKFEKNDFFIEGLDFDMSNAVAYTQYSLVDTAKNWYDWYGESYPSDSKYGGELGNRYASNSDNAKFLFANKLNMEYILNEKHSINFNSYFTLANGNPKDDLREQSVGKKAVFDSKMRSWTVGLTYDYRTKNDKFLNSFTVRHYLYTMDTKSADPFSIFGAEKVDVNKSDFGVSDALRYRFFPNIMGKLSAGYDVRIPSENELLGDGNVIQPAENLIPERNGSVNLGVLYDLTGKHPTNLQVEVSGFYMQLENMIRFTKSIWGGAKYENFGKMRTLGIEFEVKADVLPSVYIFSNVTYQDLRDIRKYEINSTVPNPTKDKRMPNIPYFMINSGVEFHKENLFGGTGQNTRIFSDMSFIEEYFYDFEMTQRDKRRIPRCLTVDLGLEHSFMNQRLFLSGKIHNLTDAKVLSEFNRPLPGRHFGVKLRYVFK
ncbi:MAG: TonB-dependent receptor [Bacteroidia bacterium]|nr:MAG: TonB-dependent receptor [Bacteroidia bacterium]